MNTMKLLCLVLTMLLALGACLAEAGGEVSAQDVEPPVEALELSLDEALAGVPDGISVSAEEAGEIPVEAGAPTAEPTVEPTVEPSVEPAPVAVPPESIDVVKKVTLGVGEKLRLEPVVEPEGAEYSEITYSSSSKSCAKVSKNGLITAKKKGKATITVKAGEVKAKVKVTVKKAPKKIGVKAERIRMKVGEAVQLTAELPAGTAGAYTWSASPKGIVELSKDGRATALKPGVVKVTAKTYNKKKASVTLTVIPEFEVMFMDIGRNDGILIQCDGEYAFIDSGMHGQGVQAAKFMKRMEVDRLKYYIGTHAHKDHVGGAPAVIAAFETGEVIVSHSGTARKIWDFAESDAEREAIRGTSYRVVSLGDTFTLGRASFEVLGPVRIYPCDTGSNAENANSLVLKLTFGKNTFLLTGDASGTELTEIEKANPGCMKAQVLKNPHHNGEQKRAVEGCQPEIVVFSTSETSLPSGKYLSYVKSAGAKYYITAPNRNGTVVISSDGKKLTVTTEK